jgi:ankyrin repeat protein
MLDTLGREFTVKILERILNQLTDQKIINELDNCGYALIHYFALVNYYEAIKLLAKFGANLNLMSEDGSYPLLIAAARGHELTV